MLWIIYWCFVRNPVWLSFRNYLEKSVMRGIWQFGFKDVMISCELWKLSVGSPSLAKKHEICIANSLPVRAVPDNSYLSKMLSVTIKKICLYVYSVVFNPFDRSKTCSFRHLLESSGKHSDTLPLLREYYQVSYISFASRGLNHTAEWTGTSWGERKCSSFDSAAEGIRTQILSVEIPAF